MPKVKEEDVISVKNKMGRVVKVSKVKAASMCKVDSAIIVETIKTLEEMTKKELQIEGIKKDIVVDVKLTKTEIISLLKEKWLK